MRSLIALVAAVSTGCVGYIDGDDVAPTTSSCDPEHCNVLDDGNKVSSYDGSDGTDGSDGSGGSDTPTEPQVPLNQVPPTLAKSGRFSADVRPFTPRWKLYSDGAEKQRFILIPPGKKIDTSLPDYWRFPVGTKLWKEFRVGTTLVETRYMVKYGSADDAWLFVPYKSNGTPALAGATNVDGTPHDIPAQSKCPTCHGNVASRVLGFSQFQLDYDAPSGQVDLAAAAQLKWLSKPITHFNVPGSATDRAVLGYFHANCGHCHNSRSQLVNHPMLRLESDHIATLDQTRAYQSSVNVAGRVAFEGATLIIKPGDPDHSIVITRMTTSDTPHRMPALGTETVDTSAVSMIRSWIQNL